MSTSTFVGAVEAGASTHTLMDELDPQTEGENYLLPTPPKKEALSFPSKNDALDWTGVLTDGVDISPLVRRRNLQLTARHFDIRQQWEGVIVDLESATFVAELRDLTVPQNPLDIVEIPIEEIPDSDLPLVALGAVFYWCIGYEVTPAGQRRRVSEIKLRRTPRWTAIETAAIHREATAILKRLNVNFDEKPAESR